MRGLRGLTFNARRTLQAWLAVYPCVLLFLATLGHHVSHWPLPLRVLVSTAVIVPVVVNIGVPLIDGLIDRALQWSSRRRPPSKADASGEEQS